MHSWTRSHALLIQHSHHHIFWSLPVFCFLAFTCTFNCMHLFPVKIYLGSIPYFLYFIVPFSPSFPRLHCLLSDTATEAKDGRHSSRSSRSQASPLIVEPSTHLRASHGKCNYIKKQIIQPIVF